MSSDDDDDELDRVVERALFRAKLRAKTLQVSLYRNTTWPLPQNDGDHIQPPSFVLLSAEAMRFQLLLTEEGYQPAALIPSEPWTDGNEHFTPTTSAVEFIRPTKRVVLYAETGWTQLEAVQLWMKGIDVRWAWTSIASQHDRDVLWAWLNR